jgi:hypothetical protein
MPIYVVHCLKCGNIEEEFFPTMDVTKWRCHALVTYMDRSGHNRTTTCKSTMMEKLPARSSFRLHSTTPGGFTNTSPKG